MYLLAILLWIVAVVWLSLRLTKNLKNPIVRAAVVVAAVPLSFALALADEIIGKYQFDKLCEEAKEVKIHATHPVGEELYTPEGKWRGSDTGDDVFRLTEIKKRFVRWDSDRALSEVIPAAIRIRKQHTTIIDETDGRLLAEWNSFSTPGGWLSRSFEAPILVRAQCFPSLFESRKIEQIVMPFKGSQGAKQ